MRHDLKEDIKDTVKILLMFYIGVVLPVYLIYWLMI